MDRKHLWSYILIMGLLLSCHLPEASGQSVHMRHYTVNDGLASSTVYTMLNDSKGYLWMCTEAGVSRFDGHKFTNFSTENGLSDNEMLRVYEDSKGRIWFLGFNGTLSYFLNGKFFNPGNDTLLAQAVSKGAFVGFFEDKLHRLWFTSYQEYVLIDGNKVMRYGSTDRKIPAAGILMNANGAGMYILTRTFKEFYPLHYLSGDTVRHYPARFVKKYKDGFCYLPDGGVLFSAREGIVLQRDTSQDLIIPLGKDFEQLTINAIYLSPGNKLWITVLGSGVYCFDYNAPAKTPEHYLSGASTCDICEDFEGNLWITTTGDGIYMLRRGFESVKNYDAATGLGASYVFSVAKAGNTFYAGLANGQVAEIERGKINPGLKTGHILPSNRITRIIACGNQLWVASDQYLLSFDKATRFSHLASCDSGFNGVLAGVKDLCLTRDHLTCATVHGVFRSRTLDPASGKNTVFYSVAQGVRAYCVYEDKLGTVWYGAVGGLYSKKAGEDSCTRHRALDSQLRVSSISETPDSVLVLATYGSGIFLYRNEHVLAHVTAADGLGSNICKRVFVHGNEIFIATNDGIALANYKNGAFLVSRRYTIGDGLASNDVNDVFADDSEICIATAAGLSVINRKNAVGIFSVPPPVYISRIQNAGVTLNTDSSYSFNFRRNSLRFDFIGIAYQQGGEVSYQYRLNDDQPWGETKNVTVEFPLLSPGSYHFQVRARTSNGPWSATRSFYFSIDPPYWRTAWFWIFCAVTFVLVVLLIARQRLKVSRSKHHEELQIMDQVAHLEQQALQAMMNPHFIFNVMNSIQVYINNNDTHEANIYLSSFAKLIRMNLEISSKKNISLDEELAYLKLYLSLESLRFGERLTYGIEIDPAIDGDETMVPVLLLQPFIENAIWHGILPKTGNGHLQINISKEQQGMLKIRITDDGVGIYRPGSTESHGVKAHISKGMKITRQRLDLISRVTGHVLYLRVEDAFPGEQFKGTAVEFLLPDNLS